MPGQRSCAQHRGECDNFIRGGKTIRCEEFLDRKMRKLDDSRTVAVDDGNQAWTRGEHVLFLILRPPIRIQRRNFSLNRIRVKSKDHRKLVNTKGSNSHSQALEKALDMTLVRFMNPLQDALVGLVQAVG